MTCRFKSRQEGVRYVRPLYLYHGGLKMTGREFEQYMCKLFDQNGFWALNIPRSESGAQPFDIVAIRKDEVYAVDCKVCSGAARFPLRRVEDNQLLAFGKAYWRTNAKIGLMVYWSGCIYFLRREDIVKAIEEEQPSIKLTKKDLFCTIGNEVF